MPRTSIKSRAPLPDTIAGLWSLCALVPFKSRAAYGEAADLCARLSVRRLNPAQREYFRELLALAEEYEDAHKESARALTALRKAAAGA
jgi:hypothetical protein